MFMHSIQPAQVRRNAVVLRCGIITKTRKATRSKEVENDVSARPLILRPRASATTMIGLPQAEESLVICYKPFRYNLYRELTCRRTDGQYQYRVS